MNVYVIQRTDGALLESYDPEWTPTGLAEYPCGLATWTNDPLQALHFVDTDAAFRTWRMRSVTVPTRPDGHPNRPLTAASVTVRRINVAPAPTQPQRNEPRS